MIENVDNRPSASAGGRSFLWKALIVILLLTAAQMIYVYTATSHFVSRYTSDSRTFGKIAADIFDGGGLRRFHHPFVYPALLGLYKMVSGGEEGIGFFMAQAAWKGVFLVAIFLLLRKKLKDTDSLIATVLIGISPLWFMYTIRYMAENIEVPLVVVALLVHFNWREEIRAEGRLGKKLGLTFAAALLAWLCLMSKYLCLVMLPVFCLIWGSGALQKGEKKKEGIVKALIWCVIYTAMVSALILAYAALIARGQGVRLSFTLVKTTLGFNAASGPERVGYQFIPQMKWVMCYTLYAMLGASVIIASLVTGATWKKTAKNLAEVLGLIGIFLVLIYVASRHSTLADYNAKWMSKLLSRYVSLMSTLGVLLMFYMLPDGGSYGGESLRDKKCLLRSAFGALAGCGIVVLAWEIIYRNALGFRMVKDFVGENRGLDMLSFWRIGLAAVFFYLIAIALSSFIRKKNFLYIAVGACFLLNDLSIYVS